MDRDKYEDFIKDFEKFINAMDEEEFAEFCNEVGTVNIEEKDNPSSKTK